MQETHIQAAEHHRLAAEAHRTVAEHSERGDFTKAVAHSEKAQEFSDSAYWLARAATKESGKIGSR